MVAKPKFSSIGDELSPETAFVQAAMALDVAGLLAQTKGDVEGLCNVGAIYIQLAEALGGGGAVHDREDVDEEALARKQGYFGFAPTLVPVDDDIEEVELENE